MAVVFAMLASYFLSRTLVPMMMHYLLPAEVGLYQRKPEDPEPKEVQNWVWHVHERFEYQFEKLRERYKGWLESSLHHRAIVLAILGCLSLDPRFSPYLLAGISSPMLIRDRCACMSFHPKVRVSSSRR